MLAEQRTSGSTGGIAPHYDSLMRISNVITLSLLLAPLLACGEDAPTRPEDGTVEAWDACVWDGQIVRALCQPELACAWNGICVPKCEDIEQCTFEGFESECNISAEQDVCGVLCNDDKECPQTGGVPLRCHNLYCEREP